MGAMQLLPYGPNQKAEEPQLFNGFTKLLDERKRLLTPSNHKQLLLDAGDPLEQT